MHAAADNIDVLHQMYAALCGDTGTALTLLENANIWEEKRSLQQSLNLAEELYIAGSAAEDELSPFSPPIRAEGEMTKF